MPSQRDPSAPTERAERAPQGWVTITRTDRSRGDSTVSVTIRDGDHDVEATLTLADFALVITGQARIPAEVRRRTIPGRNGR